MARRKDFYLRYALKSIKRLRHRASDALARRSAGELRTLLIAYTFIFEPTGDTISRNGLNGLQLTYL
jgi:hypothetical protein